MSKDNNDDHYSEGDEMIMGSVQDEKDKQDDDRMDDDEVMPTRRRLTKSKKVEDESREDFEEEGPDDAGKEKLDDQEYDADAERVQEDENDHMIHEVEYAQQDNANKNNSNLLPRQGKIKRGHADDSVIEVVRV